jgi:transcriptional regulator with XRE-family HTH domain
MSIAQDTQFEIPELDELESIEQKIEHLDKPYRNADVLEELYWNREMSQSEVADELGCSQTTVRRYLKCSDLGTRDREDTEAWSTRVGRAKFRTHKGREEWTLRDTEGATTVAVHQLLAVADGADPAEVFDSDTHVHHRTGIPWLNIPDGVEVVTPQEHSDTHRADEWTEVDGIPMLVTQGDD